MSDVFSRQPTAARSRELRRLSLVGAALVMAGLCWCALRPHLIRELALNSLGCETRFQLVGAQLRIEYGRQGRVPPPADIMLWSDWRPPPGAVTWAEWLPREQTWRVNFADADLRHLGSVQAGRFVGYSTLPQADRDRDGHIEATFRVYPERAGRPDSFAIARFRENVSEIAALVHVARRGGAGPIACYSIWHDTDADGSEEFLVRRMSLTGSPGSPGAVSLAPETIAVLGWDRPGSVLRARQLPEDGSVIVWTPVDGRPYEFSADRLIEEVCRQLLPIPEGFGAAPTTVPATQAATSAPTQAATQPAPP